MEWSEAMEEEGVALRRIAALLRALAQLAELASTRSLAVRMLVLWLLRHAEAIARDYLAVGLDPLPAALPGMPAGSAPDDALRLAASLRALARLVDRESRLIAPRRRDGASRRAPCPCAVSGLRAACAAMAATVGAAHFMPAPDTS